MSEEVKNESQDQAATTAPQADAPKELTKEEKKALKEKEKAEKALAKAQENPPKAAEEMIGKGKFEEDKLLAAHMCVVDLAEFVHESVRACLYKDAKPWIQLTDENRINLMTLVRQILTHRQPTVSVVQSLINKILQPADAAAHHTLDPLAQRPAHLIFGIVLGFKKTE